MGSFKQYMCRIFAERVNFRLYDVEGGGGGEGSVTMDWVSSPLSQKSSCWQAAQVHVFLSAPSFILVLDSSNSPPFIHFDALI